MLIHNSTQYIQASFDSEAELENVVVQNFEYIFGPSSIYLDKGMISTSDGAKTIPDGFAVDLSGRQWFIVEAELGRHSVWSHIAPQVAKQITAAIKPESKRYLIERVVTLYREDERVKEKFDDEEIDSLDIRKILDDIFSKPPVLGMPIDSVSNDLREWASTSVKIEVKLWLVRKHVELGNSKNIIYEIPEEYRPVLDTKEVAQDQDSESIASYEVSISDLLSAGLITGGSKLYLSYKRRGDSGQRQNFIATILDNGDLNIEGQAFTSPSYAAIYCINKAGSDRKTVNGWTAWKTDNQKFIASIRDEYLKTKNNGG